MVALDIIDYLITSISDLPFIVTGPGLALCALFAFRAFGLFVTLRWIKASTNLVYIVIILLVMAKYGEQIATMIQDKKQPEETTQQTN